jgi:hypothetical protein
MKIRLIHILLPASVFLFAGCLEKHYHIPDPEKEVFDFIVTEPQRYDINASRGIQYEVTDPIPYLVLAGDIFAIDRFEIRGDNTLNFERKGFSINMDRKIGIYNGGEHRLKEYEEFKLLAMVYDYTYLENCIATSMFKETELWPVFSFFAEVRLSGHTQGLYFFIEDPFEYFIEQKNSSCVIRRGYDHVIKSSSVSPDSPLGEEQYFNRFRRLYHLLPDYSGKQMYDTLSSYIDLEQYFTKLSIDMLIKNGDYTDEVIFYTKNKDGNEIFGVCPWDLDDIFADQPHEIGIDWGTGTVFGIRIYNTMNDVIADVGPVLLYSIEDDLDYKIARDDYLYQEYLKTLRKVIGKIDRVTIDNIFNDAYDRIGAFYASDSIIAQSVYDVDQTNYDLFISNLAEKRTMLKERRDWILHELDKQQNEGR